MVQEQQPRENKRIKLGIWGTKGAGKTVYMLMLYHYLERSNRFEVMLDEETDEFLQKGRNLIIDKGTFPPPTFKNVNKNYKSYSYKLRRVNSNTIVELTFFDLPGEVLQNRKEELKIKSAGSDDTVTIAEYLTKCDGILILLSPLKEDYEALGCSYFTLLDGFFRLMKIKSNKFKLEQYVVFGITKADSDEIYQRTIDDNFYQLFMEIIGPQAQLSWLKNLFYLETEEKDGITQVNINGENNRCCFIPISPFARYEKDGKMISPVILNENKTEDEPKVNESQQEDPKAGDRRQQKQREDPFGKNSSKKQNNSAGDYETPGTANNSEDSQKESQSSSNDDYETPSTANNDRANQKKHWEGKYKIDKDVTWRSLNVVEPIEWLINSIENHPS
jgi:GTPase SAR1 family protein